MRERNCVVSFLLKRELKSKYREKKKVEIICEKLILNRSTQYKLIKNICKYASTQESKEKC